MSTVTSSSSLLTKNAKASGKERLWSRACRGAKTLFFVANMVASLLLLDFFLPTSLLATANRPAITTTSFLPSHLRSFQFQDSLLDLPLISISRSLLILSGEALFLSSMAHVVAAYRTSCRERRKLLVYKFDIEAVSIYNNEFPNYHKIAVGK